MIDLYDGEMLAFIKYCDKKEIPLKYVQDSVEEIEYQYQEEQKTIATWNESHAILLQEALEQYKNYAFLQRICEVLTFISCVSQGSPNPCTSESPRSGREGSVRSSASVTDRNFHPHISQTQGCPRSNRRRLQNPDCQSAPGDGT